MDLAKYAKLLEAAVKPIGMDGVVELVTAQAKIDAAIARILIPNPVRKPEPDTSEAALLRSEYRVANFQYRTDEFENLLGWCNSDKAYAWRLVHGDSGRGKTRLVVEVCQHLNGTGTGNHWLAGFVDVARFQDGLEAFDMLFDTNKPLCIILDYAERQSDIVTELLKRSRRRAIDHPDTITRVLLVARRRSDIWEQIFRQDSDLHTLSRTALEDFQLTSVMAAYEIKDVFLAAYRDFAAHFRKSAEPPEVDFSRLSTAGNVPDIGLVHMLALMAVLAPDELSHGRNARPTQDDILSFLLDREKRHWCKAARAMNLPIEVQAENVLAEAAAAITLTSQQGAIANAVDARNVLRVCTLLAGQNEAVLDRIVALFRETYPGIGYVNGVAPDLLGDYLIMMHEG